MNMTVAFQVFAAEEGGFTARAVNHSIFTEAESWDELQANVRDVTALHFDNDKVQTTLVLEPPLNS